MDDEDHKQAGLSLSGDLSNSARDDRVLRESLCAAALECATRAMERIVVRHLSQHPVGDIGNLSPVRPLPGVGGADAGDTLLASMAAELSTELDTCTASALAALAGSTSLLPVPAVPVQVRMQCYSGVLTGSCCLCAHLQADPSGSIVRRR